MQHADVCKLVDHPPVVTPALRVGALTAADSQVDGAEIPGGERPSVQLTQDSQVMSEHTHMLL